MVVLLVTPYLLSDGVGLLASRLCDLHADAVRLAVGELAAQIPLVSVAAAHLSVRREPAAGHPGCAAAGAVTGLHPCLFEPG
jgi:hypothetical protein